jgi:ATP-dependent helicase HepA
MEVQWSMSIPERLSHALKPHLNEALFRTLVLEGGDKDLNDILPEESLQAQVKSLPVKLARKMIRQAKDRIAPLYESSQKLGQERFEKALQIATDSLNHANAARIERVKHLEAVNPLVTKDDIAAIEKLTAIEAKGMSQCEFNTSGVRMILCAPPGSL